MAFLMLTISRPHQIGLNRQEHLCCQRQASIEKRPPLYCGNTQPPTPGAGHKICQAKGSKGSEMSCKLLRSYFDNLWHTLTLFGGLAVVKNSFCSNCICLQLVWLVACRGVHLASKAGLLRYPASIDSPWLSLSLVADGRSWGRQRSFSSQAMESKWKATSAEFSHFGLVNENTGEDPGRCCPLLSIAVLCGPESRYVQIRPDSFWKTGSVSSHFLSCCGRSLRCESWQVERHWRSEL